MLSSNTNPLTREEMENVIRQGGSVMYRGPKDTHPRIINKIAELPTAADLAETPADVDAAEKQLDQQQKQIDAQRAAIKAKGKKEVK